MGFLRRTKGVFVVLLVSCLSGAAVGQHATDFSGTYLSEGGQDARTIMVISQTANQIEVRKETAGRTNTESFALDGSLGDYRTSGGVNGKGSAHWKGAELIVETFVTAPPKDGKTIRFHTKETWTMSKDLKTIKIRTEIDSPGMPRQITDSAFPTQTVVYHRSPTMP